MMADWRSIIFGSRIQDLVDYVGIKEGLRTFPLPWIHLQQALDEAIITSAIDPEHKTLSIAGIIMEILSLEN